MILPIVLAAATALPMPVRLADGATWTIVGEHSRSTERDGQVEGWSLRTEKQLVWRKGRGGANAEVSVTPISATPGDGSPPEVATGRSFPIPVVIEVDDQVSPVSFVDTKPVRTAFAGIVQRDIKGQEQIADAAAMAMVASELGVASRGQGLPLVLGKPNAYDALLPGPLGGLQVKAKAAFTLHSHDAASGRALVTWEQVVDPASFKAGAEDLLKIVAKTKPQELDKARAAFGAMSMSREDRCRYEIDLATGLAVKSDCTIVSTVTDGGKAIKTTETWAVSQTVPELR